MDSSQPYHIWDVHVPLASHHQTMLWIIFYSLDTIIFKANLQIEVKWGFLWKGLSSNYFSFQSASDNVILHIFSLPRTSGLAPIYINADSGQFRPGATITLGARGDSYYEYLLKQWIQMGKKDEK